MDEEVESGQSGNEVTVYEVDTAGIEDRLDDLNEQVVALHDDFTVYNDNVIGGVGVMIGLFGLVLGFNAAKELLKIWLH